MGLLNDTVLDALRPLPTAGAWLRRSVDPNIDAAPPEMEEPIEDSGAMTVYRLQKDGGGGLPAVPSDPRVGDAGMSAPLPAPAVILSEHDAPPRVESWMSDRQESKAPVDAQDRQDRHVSAVSVPSSEYVGASTVLSSDSSRVPEGLDRVSKLVERDEGESNARRDGGLEAPSGRAPPSGDPYRPATTVRPTVEAMLADAVRPMGRSDLHYDKAEASVAPTPSLDARAHDAGTVPDSHTASSASGRAPDRTDAATPSPTGMPPDPTAAAVAGRARPDRAHAAARHETMGQTAQASRAQAPQLAAETVPRLHIGQIEVVVVAQDKPESKSTMFREDSFLSRNYLRRL